MPRHMSVVPEGFFDDLPSAQDGEETVDATTSDEHDPSLDRTVLLRQPHVELGDSGTLHDSPQETEHAHAPSLDHGRTHSPEPVPEAKPEPSAEPDQNPAPKHAAKPVREPVPEPVHDKDEDQVPEHADVLSRDEVAAVSMDRSIYVSDVPSPYLSERQAQEDVKKTKRRHSVIVTTITIVLVLATVGAIVWFLWDAIKPKDWGTVPTFETATIERGEFVESTVSSALVQPAGECAVVSNVSGTVNETHVEEGSFVNEGDVLFVLQNTSITDALDKAQKTYDAVLAEADAKLAKIDEANAAVDAAIAAYNNSTNDNDRLAAYATLQAAQKRADTAQIESNAAEANLQAVQETLDRAKEQSENLTVHAPISGVVSEINPGAMISANILGSTRLCVISDESSYRIQVEVPADKRYRMDEGQEVRLSFPSIPDFSLTTSIAYIEDNEEQHLATIILDEPDERITKGIAVETSIIIQTIPDSLMVPNNALHMAEDGSTHLDVLLDPTRGIHSDVAVNIVAQDETHAAVEASNIQVGNAVILQPQPENG